MSVTYFRVVPPAELQKERHGPYGTTVQSGRRGEESLDSRLHFFVGLNTFKRKSPARQKGSRTVSLAAVYVSMGCARPVTLSHSHPAHRGCAGLTDRPGEQAQLAPLDALTHTRAHAHRCTRGKAGPEARVNTRLSH